MFDSWAWAFLLGFIFAIVLKYATHLIVTHIPSPAPLQGSNQNQLGVEGLDHELTCSDNIYRCGWLYVRRTFEDRLDFDLRLLQTVTSSVVPVDVFFGVLQGPFLALYSDESQQSCAYSLELSGALVELFPAGMFADEVYKKEFPIKISKQREDGAAPDLFYLYTPNASEKEDWLLALRIATGAMEQDNRRFAIYMSKVHQQLGKVADGTGAVLSAIVSRVMPHLTSTTLLRRMIEIKFQRRERTLRKPFFIGDVTLEDMGLGDGFPIITNGHLHPESGCDLLASLDIEYTGGYWMRIVTSVRLEISAKLMAPLVIPIELTVCIKRVSGRLLAKIKAPPSDRLWVGFQEPPQIELDINPVLSSTSVKWSLVTSLIERGVREAMIEFLVLPNMDDQLLPPPIVGTEYFGLLPYLNRTMPPETMLDHIGEAIALESGRVKLIPKRSKSLNDLPVMHQHEPGVDDDDNITTKKRAPIDPLSLVLPATSFIVEGASMAGMSPSKSTQDNTLDKIQAMGESAQKKMLKLQTKGSKVYRGIRERVSSISDTLTGRGLASNDSSIEAFEARERGSSTKSSADTQDPGSASEHQDDEYASEHQDDEHASE